MCAQSLGNRPEAWMRWGGWYVAGLVWMAAGCSSHLSTGTAHVTPGSYDLGPASVQTEEQVVEREPTVQSDPEPIAAAVVPDEPAAEATSATDRPSAPPHDVYASSGQPGAVVPQMPSSLPDADIAIPDPLAEVPFTLSDIFFDYDQYTLEGDDAAVLETNAQVLLARYPGRTLLIQGHTDERGTEEYNMALGVRRAQVVKEYLIDLGVPADRLKVLSYGKARPFCTSHTVNCWRHNRRSHFVFP